jgi:hypothetical protein
MFALFNLGAQELLILLVIGVLLVGGPILAIIIVVSLTRRKGPANDPGAVGELQSEVKRLREDVERLKRGTAGQDAAGDRPRG